VTFKLVVLVVELLLFLNISSGLTIVAYVVIAYTSACMVSFTATRVVGRPFGISKSSALSHRIGSCLRLDLLAYVILRSTKKIAWKVLDRINQNGSVKKSVCLRPRRSRFFHVLTYSGTLKVSSRMNTGDFPRR
jgi:hypothetical protein